MMVRALFIPLVVCALSWPDDARAQVCPCPPMLAPAAALADATVVFEGTLTTTTPGVYRANDEYSLSGQSSFWRVTRAWKGTAAGATLRVFTTQECVIAWTPGARYLVYARPLGVNTDPTTSRCMRTRPIEQAREDLAALGAPASTSAAVDAGAPARIPPLHRGCSR